MGSPNPDGPEETKPNSCFAQRKKEISIGVFLVSGTMSVVLNKILYGIKAPGIGGSGPHKFEKPWFTNWAMFLGMTLCLVGFFFIRIIQKGRGKAVAPIDKRLYLTLLIPATCDMIASFLMGVGLLWIPGSVWQMLRGSIIIFTAILKVFYRKKSLLSAEIFGITTVVCALVVVGFSSFYTPGEVEDVLSSSSSLVSSSEEPFPLSPALKITLGILLVVAAQALQAFQTIIEEKFLHDMEAPEPFIVGMEGLYGLLLCSFISMPIAYFLPGREGLGLHENTLDSFVMVSKNPVLLAVNLVYIVVILVFNLFGMMITQVTDAMLRNIMEPIRTLLVWVTMVFVCYVVTKQKAGERVNLWSLLQLAGFIVLSFGILVYNGVIRFKCFKTKSDEHGDDEEKVDETKPLIVNGSSDH